MQHEKLYQELILDIETEFPNFRIVAKRESSLHQCIDKILRVLTFGQMTSYLDGYQTTLGQRVYVTSDWETRSFASRSIVLRHERVHLRQFRRYTFLGMAILYVLVPLPMGLAYFRARFELDAYEESIRATAEICGVDAAKSPRLKEHILRQFTGPSYGWMWPFPASMNRWYDEVIESLET